MTLGKSLREKRRINDLTQAELAELADVSRANISQYEHGLKKPSLETLIALADVLDCSIDGLLDRQKYIGKE
ncbi:MAG: helix-turn-helix transcriptional regulator [Ruminococcus flavefaciens]|nr:helix-turn-helix transcriptional regulator [Ruminococcus flavefaciens]